MKLSEKIRKLGCDVEGWGESIPRLFDDHGYDCDCDECEQAKEMSYELRKIGKILQKVSTHIKTVLKNDIY